MMLLENGPDGVLPIIDTETGRSILLELNDRSNKYFYILKNFATMEMYGFASLVYYSFGWNESRLVGKTPQEACQNMLNDSVFRDYHGKLMLFISETDMIKYIYHRMDLHD